MFTRAITCTPCQNMINGISNANLGLPDYQLALKQHKSYVAALAQCGLDVTVLPTPQRAASVWKQAFPAKLPR